MTKVLVISSCTGMKTHKPVNQLTKADFLDPKRLRTREEELSEYALPAAKMYTGAQHLRLFEGVSTLRGKYGEDCLDVYIVSAGYGLISEHRTIAPYELTFNTMGKKEIRQWSQFLNIHDDLNKLIADYQIVFFLLGEKYLSAIELPLEGVRENQRLIFLAAPGQIKNLPREKAYYWVKAGEEEAKAFSYGLVGLKGQMFKLLAQELSQNEPEMQAEIYQQPEKINLLLDKHRINTSLNQQATLFPDSNIEGTVKPERLIKKGERILKPMRYFIPEWDDRVDPQYDFLTDTHTPDRDPYTHDVYAHEIYPSPNYDGILVSKIKVEENQTKKKRIEELGIHQFLRFPADRPIIGDCGAFDYVDQYEPPYTTEEILNYYQSLGFNMGVSIDHLIVGEYARDVDERQRRYDLTRRNAEEFLIKHREGGYDFIPYGVAQGWDPISYRNAVGALVEMGYLHICLGGLTRTPTKQILEILKETSSVITDDIELHLFGVARLDAIPEFKRMGVTSFDSASHLRRAWLGSGSNYFTMDGSQYAAIRVPPVNGRGQRVKKMLAEGRGTVEQFLDMERRSLEALRLYDRGLMDLEQTLETVLSYDELIGDDRSRHAEMYRRVLQDQPWKSCDCPICKSIGIEVIIFRGNNRNRRRGFHNTYVFYQQFNDVR